LQSDDLTGSKLWNQLLRLAADSNYAFHRFERSLPPHSDASVRLHNTGKLSLLVCG
jgi:hypothetical protein